MKKFFMVVAAIAITFIGRVDAQTSLKHIKGAMTISAGPVMTDNAFGGMIGESYWFNTKLNWDLRLQFLTGGEEYTDYNSISLDNQLCYNILGVKNKFYTDFVFGLQFGFDKLSSTLESDSKSAFMCVGEVGLKLKYYIKYNWSIWLEGKECIGESQINKLYPQFTLGGSWMLPGINNRSAKKFN